MKSSIFWFICCSLLTYGESAQSQVLPTFYTNFLVDTMRANGSSPTGHCLSFDITIPNAYCYAPATSVLFDGAIPTLTELNGDTWASELLTLETEANINLFESYVSVLFLFHNQPDYTGVRRIELVLFNCPEWGVSVGSVEVNEFDAENTTTLAIQSFSSTSCDSLVRVCVPVSTSSTNLQVKFLSVPSPQFYVYLAEVIFYADSSACPPEAVVSADSVTTPRSPDPQTSSSSGSTPCSAQSETCPSCTPSNSRASVITAIATALLATVIFVPVQIAVCMCLPKFTPGRKGAQEDGEDPVYEQISEDESSSDGKGNSPMNVSQNESYNATTPVVIQDDQRSSSTMEPVYDYMLCDD